MEGTNQMLTAKEVAEILGVHPKTVHIWLREGKLHGVKISYRAWRIPQGSFNQFIEMNSNALSRVNKDLMNKNEDKKSGIQPNEPTVLSVDQQATPQLKMKHYLRDIMGEDHGEKPRG